MVHGAWLRRIAVGLLHDSDEADDAVAETWRAALQHRPSADQPARPWLARVMTNFARNRRRAARRRRQHEREAAAIDAAVPTPEAMAATLELQRQAAALIQELAEPYRQVVYLRYVEDWGQPRSPRSWAFRPAPCAGGSRPASTSSDASSTSPTAVTAGAGPPCSGSGERPAPPARPRAPPPRPCRYRLVRPAPRRWVGGTCACWLALPWRPPRFRPACSPGSGAEAGRHHLPPPAPARSGTSRRRRQRGGSHPRSRRWRLLATAPQRARSPRRWRCGSASWRPAGRSRSSFARARPTRGGGAPLRRSTGASLRARGNVQPSTGVSRALLPGRDPGPEEHGLAALPLVGARRPFRRLPQPRAHPAGSARAVPRGRRSGVWRAPRRQGRLLPARHRLRRPAARRGAGPAAPHRPRPPPAAPAAGQRPAPELPRASRARAAGAPPTRAGGRPSHSPARPVRRGRAQPRPRTARHRGAALAGRRCPPPWPSPAGRWCVASTRHLPATGSFG
jgi:Sigma-70 region 2